MRKSMGHRLVTLVILLGRYVRILQRLRLKVERLRPVVVLVIADCRRHTVELQTDAGGARPRVRRRRIALDFAPTASFACSHHCSTLALAYLGSAVSHRTMVHTFQAFVSIMLVYEYIVWRVLSVAFSHGARWHMMDSLRWFSRGASVGGAKVKLCICAVCGRSGRPVVSCGIPSMCTTSRSGVPARGLARWLQAAGSSAIH